MTSKEFARLLRALRESAEFAGDAVGANQLESVANAFDSAPESGVNKTLVRRLRSSFATKGSQMNIQRALRHLKFFRSASSEIARKSELDAMDVVIGGLNDNVAPKTPKPSVAPVESELGQTYLTRLLDAGADRETGEKILDDLRKNKAMDVAKLNWLVQQYAGGAAAYQTRPKAISRIETRFATVVRRGEKSDEIKRLTERD